MEEFIRKLPKAELHLHIEGSLMPQLMFDLAKRNNIKLKFNSIAEVEAAYNFNNLQSFLDIYYEGAGVLLKKEDFFDLTWEYLERAKADNVRHTEIFFDPQTHTDRGVAFSTAIEGIHEALEKGRKELDISSEIIMCYLRHLDEKAAEKTLDMALEYKSIIKGVGLDSSEVGHPPSKFKNVFERSLKEGFLTVAHAGEEGPPEYIWEALDLLKVSRIDHGVRCVEDEKLVARLVKEQMPLTVCPLSNIKLCVFDKMEDHNFKTLLELGLNVSINSDDPSYFGGYMTDNYLATAKGTGLSQDELKKVAINSFNSSFIGAELKAKYINEVEALSIS